MKSGSSGTRTRADGAFKMERSLEINIGKLYAIIGVMPKEIRFSLSAKNKYADQTAHYAQSDRSICYSLESKRKRLYV